jgi:hypothetical protein
VENGRRNQPLKSKAAAIVENAVPDSLVFAVIARSEATKQSSFLSVPLDCRAARRPKDDS